MNMDKVFRLVAAMRDMNLPADTLSIGVLTKSEQTELRRLFNMTYMEFHEETIRRLFELKHK